MLLLSRNYVFRVDPSISDYSRLFWTCRASTISDLPINLRLSRKRVSPLVYTLFLLLKLHPAVKGNLLPVLHYLALLQIALFASNTDQSSCKQNARS